MSVSFAGRIVCEVNVREGRESAAAQTLDEEEGAFAVPGGDVGEVAVTCP